MKGKVNELLFLSFVESEESKESKETELTVKSGQVIKSRFSQGEEKESINRKSSSLSFLLSSLDFLFNHLFYSI